MRINNIHKNIIIITLSVVSIGLFATVVYGLGTWDTGYRANNSVVDQEIDIDSGGTKKCITNNSGRDIFIPTNTAAEWTAFENNTPAGVSVADCCTINYYRTTGGLCCQSPTIGFCASQCASSCSGSCPGTATPVGSPPGGSVQIGTNCCNILSPYQSGQFIFWEYCCTPDCIGKECGDDGCGGSCGTCGSNATCPASTCVCDAGWDDCDGDNSCECDLSVNECSGGSCVPSSGTWQVASCSIAIPCSPDTCGVIGSICSPLLSNMACCNAATPNICTLICQ